MPFTCLSLLYIVCIQYKHMLRCFILSQQWPVGRPVFACFAQMTELCVSCSAAVKKHEQLEAHGEGTWNIHTHSAGLCPHLSANQLLKPNFISITLI